jgi:xanthine dehydrogenase accessory factor
MSTTTDLRLFERIETQHNQGKPMVLATIISKSGSVPREAGARMLIWADGSAEGSVGGGCVEALVRAAARDVLLVSKLSRTIKVSLTEQEQGGTGDVCGGSMELFLDYIHREVEHVQR